MFDWDEHSLRKVRAHLIMREEVEQALSNDPILIYEQSVGEEGRYVYYGESDIGRLLATSDHRAPGENSCSDCLRPGCRAET